MKGDVDSCCSMVGKLWANAVLYYLFGKRLARHANVVFDWLPENCLFVLSGDDFIFPLYCVTIWYNLFEAIRYKHDTNTRSTVSIMIHYTSLFIEGRERLCVHRKKITFARYSFYTYIYYITLSDGGYCGKSASWKPPRNLTCKCSNHNLIQTLGTAIARGFIQMTSSMWMKRIYSEMNSISPCSKRNSQVFSRERTDWYGTTLERIAGGHWKQSGLSQKKVSVHQKKESRYSQQSTQ